MPRNWSHHRDDTINKVVYQPEQMLISEIKVLLGNVFIYMKCNKIKLRLLLCFRYEYRLSVFYTKDI